MGRRHQGRYGIPPARVTRCERCDKNAYPNPVAAYQAALRSSLISGSPMRVYGCPHGAGFHLTRQR